MTHPDPAALERSLSTLWCEILSVAAVDPAADFTELGGNSLHAARIVARVRTGYGLDLSLRDLFVAGTVRGLARLVAGRHVGTPAGLAPLHRQAGASPVPSLSQQRLWFLDRLDTGGVAYNVPLATWVRGPVEVAALRGAFEDLVRRHEQLRTSFHLVEGRLTARVADALPPLQLVDLRDHPDPEAVARQRSERLAAEHLDLGTAPLLRCLVFRTGEDRHLVTVVLHHMVSDGLTVDILDRELAEFYQARLAGGRAPLPQLRLEYRDFARWQHDLAGSAVLADLLGHWRGRLAGVPTELELPADHPRPALRSHRGRRITTRTPDGVLPAVRDLAVATRTTPYAVCLAAFAVLLRRLTGRRDLLVASPTAGRPDPALEDVVGFFTNTVPIRLRPGDGTFRELVGSGHATTLDALEHQYVPFERLVAELAPAGDLSRAPLAQVALAYQGPRRAHARLEGTEVEPVPLDNGTAKFDLTIEVHEVGTALEVTAECSTDLFAAERARHMLDGYLDLLATAVEAPDTPLADLAEGAPGPRPPAREGDRRPAGEWDGRCLHEIFAATAARHPDAVAVTDGTRRLTYAELDRTANRLAHRLRARGAQPERLVGLCAERTVDLVVGVLAILKAGAGYLPLDPRHPAARLKLTLDDADCRLLLGDGELCAPLAGPGRTLVELGAPLHDEPADPPETGVRPDHAAYVIYTSGSTGRSKGVVVTHANATRLFTATENDFGFGPQDVWTLFHSIAFDFSVWELWGPLLYGGRLVVVPYLTSRDPVAFLDLLRAERVTVLNQTPTAFRQLAGAAEDAGFPGTGLRYVVFGGEALDPAMLRGWVGGYGTARPRLVNMYGITETTVHVTIRPIQVSDLAGSISPIGRPIADLRVHVLDGELREVPPGVEGEMYVGGPGVARGYLNRPELTAERFVRDPFGAPGDRLYRSGDLAVRTPDGELEYRGRADDQVKLNGFRIELGEIERALLDQPGVRAAACMLREDTPGLPRIVGYLVPSSGAVLRPADVRTALLEHLPAHMVPAALVEVPALPLTTNGKLDRARLPAPPTAVAAPEPSRAGPRTATERALAAVWAQVLGIDEPGVHDNFFALGGDSIVAIRLGVAAKAAGLAVTIERIFLCPTIAELAEACDAAPSTAPAPAELAAADLAALAPGVVDAYPTAAMQLAILFECELADAPGLYHDLISAQVTGEFDRPALERSLATMSARHEILRTSFNLGRFSEPMQLVHQEAHIPLAVEDASSGPADDAAHEARLREWWLGETAEQFDLDRPPLVRCHVLRRTARSYQLSLLVHHSVLDGWSLARLMTELLQEYDAQLGGRSAPLAPLVSGRYRDFVAAEQAAVADPAAARFWHGTVGGLPAASLPVLPGRGGDGFAWHTVLPEALDGDLRRVAAELGFPLKSVFLAAHLWALRQLVDGPDVACGVQVNGRLEHEGSDLLLGLFLNLVPVAVTVDRGTWAELIGAAFTAERELQPYRRYPLARMQQLAGRDRSLFEAAFNYTDFHTFDELGTLARIRTRDWRFADRHSFPLMVEVVRSPGTGERAIVVSAGVDSPLAGTGVRLGELFFEALQQLVTDPRAAYPTGDPVSTRTGPR